jgi:hypothetical protein
MLLVGCAVGNNFDLFLLSDGNVWVQNLQETMGYSAFEGRRRAKFTKGISGRAMLGRNGVDEGVDVALMRS